MKAYRCDGRDDSDGGADDRTDGCLLFPRWVLESEGGVLVDGLEASSHGG